MGLEDDELPILAASIESFNKPTSTPWSSPLKPKEYVKLFGDSNLVSDAESERLAEKIRGNKKVSIEKLFKYKGEMILIEK
jgi:hypothetical protein